MPISLRARPTCHYCGKRNSPSNNQRKFTCQYCQAENYLDESGQITDVPASAATTPRQYAVPVAPTFDNAEESIFCSTCLKNQHMYNAALAEYLPDIDHPEYDKFEAALPEFKKDLERRFPTCCANCEPRVKAQLQQATYNARSDHVRRVLDRSRQRRNAHHWGWRSLVVSAAGLGWHISLAAQLLWHAIGSQARDGIETPVTPMKQCLSEWPVPAQCPSVLERYVGPSLLLAVLCLWWNPKWQHKVEGREGRLTGLDKFYKAQCALTSLRFMMWTAIKDIPGLAKFRPMIHAVSLVLIIMIAVWSRFKVIEIYMPRIVDWSQDPAPLLDTRQFVPPAPTQEISPPNSQQAVPVGVFNTSTQRAVQSWRPPTPPRDEDAMEWDPTPNTFSPNLREIKYKSSEPTPFRGTLPAFPQSGIYQRKKEAAVEQPKAIGLPLGFFDKSHGKSLSTKRADETRISGLAQPKFFPDMGRADTGLENIFDKVFSLQDGATVPRKGSNASSNKIQTSLQEGGHRRQIHPASEVLDQTNKIYNVVMSAILASATILFSIQCYVGLPLFQAVSIPTLLRFMVAVPLLDICAHVLPSLSTSRSVPDAFKIIMCLTESSGLFVLHNVRPEFESLLLPLWNKLVVASLFLLLVQQVYSFCVNSGVTPVQIHPSTVDNGEKVTSTVTAFSDRLIQPVALEPDPTVVPANFRPVRRSSSDESLASTASIATTSTASGWKTPLRNHREELRGGSSSTSYGFGGLSLSNSHQFGAGSSIVEPRNRRTPARANQRGW